MRYDKKKGPIFESLKNELTQLKDENERLISESDNIKDVLDSTLHEVRRFSAQLSKFAERLTRGTDPQSPLGQAALSIFYTAGMISSRLAYTDIELNPSAAISQNTLSSGIYKKFDKANRILTEEARNKNIKVSLRGQSFVEIDASPVFELLPFVLLDNAIKYSPNGQEVTITFEEEAGNNTIITICSMGPHVDESELPHLFENKFRGAHVKQMPGQGLGLFLAKKVCEIHGLKIRAEIGHSHHYQVSGIDYSEFKVILDYPS